MHKRYAKSENPSSSYGMLAISISKILNENLGILEASNSIELSDKIFAYNYRFIEQNKSNWKNNKDPRSIGVVVVQDAPCLITKNKQFTTVHEVTMNNAVPVNSAECQLLLKVANRIFNRPT